MEIPPWFTAMTPSCAGGGFPSRGPDALTPEAHQLEGQVQQLPAPALQKAARKIARRGVDGDGEAVRGRGEDEHSAALGLHDEHALPCAMRDDPALRGERLEACIERGRGARRHGDDLAERAEVDLLVRPREVEALEDRRPR